MALTIPYGPYGGVAKRRAADSTDRPAPSRAARLGERPLYAGLDVPVAGASAARLAALRARRVFVQWLFTLAVAGACLLGALCATTAVMEGGYRLDQLRHTLQSAQSQELDLRGQLAQEQSLAHVEQAATSLGMHLPSGYATFQMVPVADHASAPTRTAVITLPATAPRQPAVSPWQAVRHWFGLAG